MFSEDLVTFAGKPFEVTQDIRVQLSSEGDEITGMGLRVKKIELREGVAPRYYVDFPKDQPQYKVRAALEAKGYEVGQKLGSKELGFYVAKRVKQGQGWEV